MKRMVLAGVIGLVSAAAAVPAAMAQQPAMVIGFLDKNGDAKCDLNEYLGYQVSRIAEFDKDSDGALNEAEFKASLQGKSKQGSAMLFRGANTEGGRTLSQKEFLGYQAWVFNKFIDADHDGFMSAEEWTSVVQKAG